MLLKIKRMMLHDKDSARREIAYYRKQINNGKFRFRYLSPKQQGRNFDPTRQFEEDLAGISFDKKTLLTALKDLDQWVIAQEPYKYPAEING